MHSLFGCRELLPFQGGLVPGEKSGSSHEAGAVVKTVTFDAIVPARAGGTAGVFRHARQSPTQTSLQKTTEMKTKRDLLPHTLRNDSAWKVQAFYITILIWFTCTAQET
jgi:hypothetical protein